MKNLTKREQLLLKILIICAAGAVIYYLIIIPLTKISVDNVDSSNGIEKLEKLEKIYSQYREIQQKKSIYTSMLNRKNDNTSSLIEQWLNSTGLTNNIGRTTSKQTNIQNKYTRITTNIKLDDVPIQNFFKFLYEVENSDNLIKINYLRIRQVLRGRKSGSGRYDINLKIDNFISK